MENFIISRKLKCIEFELISIQIVFIFQMFVWIGQFKFIEFYLFFAWIQYLITT